MESPPSAHVYLPKRSSVDWARAVEDALSACGGLEGALLPVLHAVQETLGFIPDDALPAIARGLNVSRAEVHGVVTFYHHFRSSPPGKVVVQVCRAEACQALGGDLLLQQTQRRLGCEGPTHTSPDGRFTVEPVYCLGLCASSPAAQVCERPLGRLTLEQLVQAAERALAEVQAKEASA